MVNITILEVHLDDAIFEANAPFAGEVSEGEETEEADEAAAVDGPEGNGGAPKVAPLVFGLVFLVALAALARKLRRRGGGEEEEEETLEEIEPAVEAA